MDISTTSEVLSEEPAGERWDPLGAPNDEEDVLDENYRFDYQCEHGL